MESKKVQSLLKERRWVAVIRGKNEAEAISRLQCCQEEGVKAIELTLTIPNAIPLIEKTLSKKCEKELVGAGTVLTLDEAKKLIQMGVDFIVSPGLNLEIARFCQEKDFLYIPGVFTPTEVTQAVSAGLSLLKLFPSQFLGAEYLRALKAPFPQAEFMPTGGISIDNLADWFKSGAVCLGIGSPLFGSKEIDETRKIIQAFSKAIEKLN